MTGVIVCPIFSGLPPSNQQLAEAGRDVTLGAKRADRSLIPSPLSRIVADASVAAPARRLDGYEGLVRDAALPESSCASPGIQANRSSDDPLRTRAGGTTCDKTGNALLGVIGLLPSTQCETSAGPGRVEIKATQMESQPWRLQRNGTNGWKSMKQGSRGCFVYRKSVWSTRVELALIDSRSPGGSLLPSRGGSLLCSAEAIPSKEQK